MLATPHIGYVADRPYGIFFGDAVTAITEWLDAERSGRTVTAVWRATSPATAASVTGGVDADMGHSALGDQLVVPDDA